MNRSVRKKHGFAFGDHYRQAKQQRIFLCGDDAGDVLHTHIIVAGGTGYHCIAIAMREQGCGKQVAIIFDASRAVTTQESMALQAFISCINIGLEILDDGSIGDFNALGVGDAHFLHMGFHLLGAAYENWRSVAIVAPLHSGADDAIVLAFGKYHALWIGFEFFKQHAHAVSGWVAAGSELHFICVPVFNRLTSHTGFHSSFRNCNRNSGHQARIKRGRDDVVWAEFHFAARIRGGHFFGHFLACEHGECLRRCDFHFIINFGGANIECATEDVRKAHHVIHLVWIVRTASCNNCVTTHCARDFRTNFRIRICHREDDRVFGHAFEHFRCERIFGRQTKKHIRTFKGIRKRAFVGFHRMGGLPLIHAWVVTALINDAGFIA